MILFNNTCNPIPSTLTMRMNITMKKKKRKEQRVLVTKGNHFAIAATVISLIDSP